MILCKLKCYGIHGICLKWIESYLYYRIQQIKLSNTLSNDFIVYSGVSQLGSYLVNPLFLTFINNIITSFDVGITILLFSDNIKINTKKKY